MEPLSEKVLKCVKMQPGITDRWLAEALFGPGTPQQRVNGECRHLADMGLISRSRRSDGLIGNYPIASFGTKEPKNSNLLAVPPGLAAGNTTLTDVAASQVVPVFAEDEVKRVLEKWLNAQNWSVEIAWARTRGIDIHAQKGKEKWIIEVKGGGSLNAMRVNYFLGVLGETLQRMDDARAQYSIALPDLMQFRNLWSRLPALAKERTRITALFVKPSGEVDQVI